MYDESLRHEPLELADPMADMMSELDLFYDCLLDPDKPFVSEPTEEELERISKGADRWLMGAAGIL